MLTSEARALVTEIQDRLIDLYVQQDEARGEHDPDRARELQVEIDKATAQREEIRPRAPSWTKQNSGGVGMAKAASRTQRRHVREKATIDHLVRDVYEPKAPDETHAEHSPTTSTGLPVEDQVRKEWDTRKGGLPTFWR
jgi:hypothetical protein